MQRLAKLLAKGLCLTLVAASVAALGMLVRSFYISDSAIYTNQYYRNGEFHRECWLVNSERGGLGFGFSTLTIGKRRTATDRPQMEMFMHPGRTVRTNIFPGFPTFYPNDDLPRMLRFGGFIIGRTKFGNDSVLAMRDGTFDLNDRYGLTIPYWAISLLAAIWPLRAFYKRRRMLRRVASGRCGRCGYDLRATSGRCPECGMLSKRLHRLPG